MGKKIAIVGGGWYGCHTALKLAEQGFDVTIYEKESEIFRGISGKFGIRLHVGPHYPRSEDTRVNCQQNFLEFMTEYPELATKHAYSHYALGTRDADGKPPKVSRDKFDNVCKEFNYLNQVDLLTAGYNNVTTAHNLDEPSLKLGAPLREFFVEKLASAGVQVRYNAKVSRIYKDNEGNSVQCGEVTEQFDHVVNMTSFKEHLPPGFDQPGGLPQGISVVYQPCLALVYKDKYPHHAKMSFIAMDGWFPCLMPYNDTEDSNKYVVTHGKWTILDSCKSNKEAELVLSQITDDIIRRKIQPNCEKEMNRFWPRFKDRFEFVDWKASTLAKPITNTEFRSAMTFLQKSTGITHVIPGKVSNVFDVFREVLDLINGENLVSDQVNSDFLYPENGVLASCSRELTADVEDHSRNTAYLAPYADLITRSCDNLLALTQHGMFATQKSQTKNSSAVKLVGQFTSEKKVIRSPSVSTLVF